MNIKKYFRDKLSISYLLLVISLGLHVTDEAINNFLDFYNPLVLKLKEHLVFFPFPTFTFKIWIIGLSLVTVLLLLLTPFIYKRNRFFLPIVKIFAILMIFNGLGHFAGSIYYVRILAGMITSPLLILFSIYFIYQIQQKNQPVRSKP